MGLHHSPRIVTDGLVFCYDMGNTEKSWRGKPTTNFFTNGHFSNGNGIPQESGSNPSNEVVLLDNPGNSPYVLKQTVGVIYTEYQINLTTELSSSKTYCLSGWYAESPDYVGFSRMFHCRAFSASGNNVTLGPGLYNVITTIQYKGLTWKFCYATITTPSDYSNSFNWYVGYDGSDYSGARYYTNLQMEEGNYPSRFVDGTRSSTQSILDLTRNNTITINSLSYGTDGNFSFADGVNYLSLSNIGSIVGDITLEAAVNLGTRNGPHQTAITTDINYLNGFCLLASYHGSLSAWAGFGSISFLSNSNRSIENTGNNIICATRSLSTGVISVYLNGVLISSENGNTGNMSSTGASSGRVGIEYHSASYGFNGKIYFAKVYNKVLTGSQILQNYNAMKGRFGLL